MELPYEETVHAVKEYYGRVLQTSSDLKTSACACGERPHPVVADALSKVPEAVMAKFYGCGNPIPLGIEGLDVLDLGCGSGRDCFACAVLVGPSGSVTGVDMTDEQLATARASIDEFAKKVGWEPKLTFVKGYIEMLAEAGIKPNSIDLCISNCVVNLSPNKRLVLQGVYDALRWGGEMYFSDVYCDRRLPDAVRSHQVLLGECLAGALYEHDFIRLCRDVGFTDPREVSRSEISVSDPELKAVVGPARFYSITYRLFKVKGLETLCEDYGQVAIYRGTIKGQEGSYSLDASHCFEAGKPERVCGNTAAMLQDSWLGKHFEVQGDRTTHYGIFPCGPASSSSSSSACCPPNASSSACCPPTASNAAPTSSSCCSTSKSCC